MNSEPQKTCRICGKIFPATTDFFYNSRKKGDSIIQLKPQCKKCCNSEGRTRTKKQKRNQLRCRTCGNTYPATIDFYHMVRHAQTGEMHARSPCKYCVKKRRENHLVASGKPPKPAPVVINPDTIGQPNQCNACGSTSGNILGDVDKATLYKYGYLCAKCYRIAHDFGKDPKRLRLVVAYLELTRPNG